MQTPHTVLEVTIKPRWLEVEVAAATIALQPAGELLSLDGRLEDMHTFGSQPTLPLFLLFPFIGFSSKKHLLPHLTPERPSSLFTPPLNTLHLEDLPPATLTLSNQTTH